MNKKILGVCVPLLAALSACVHLIIENPVLNEMPQARNDAALVYFFLPDSRTYRLRKNQYRYGYENVYDADDFIGALKPGSFFFMNFEAGAHTLSCLAINLEAGQTYYLERGLQVHSDYVKMSPRVMSDSEIRDPRVHNNDKREGGIWPRNLCYRQFVAVTAAYAKPIIANLTYTVVKIGSR